MGFSNKMKTRICLALIVAGALTAIPCYLKRMECSNRIQEIRDLNPQVFQSEPAILETRESNRNEIYTILNGIGYVSIAVGGYYALYNLSQKKKNRTKVL